MENMNTLPQPLFGETTWKPKSRNHYSEEPHPLRLAAASPDDHEADTGQNLQDEGPGGDPGSGNEPHAGHQMPTNGGFVLMTDWGPIYAGNQTDLASHSPLPDCERGDDTVMDIFFDALSDPQPPQSRPPQFTDPEQWEQNSDCGEGYTGRSNAEREDDQTDEAGIDAAPKLEQNYNSEDNGSRENMWLMRKKLCQEILLEACDTLNLFNNKIHLDKYVAKLWSSDASTLFKSILRTVSTLAVYGDGCFPQSFGQSAPWQATLPLRPRAFPKRASTPVVSSLQHRRPERPLDHIPSLVRQGAFLDHFDFDTTRHIEVDRHVRVISAKKRATERTEERVWQYFISHPSLALQPENNAKDMRNVYTRLIARSNPNAKPWNGVLSDVQAASHNPFSEWIDCLGTRKKIYDLFGDVPGLSIEVCRVKGHKNVKLFVLTPPPFVDDKEHTSGTTDITSKAKEMNKLLAELKVNDVDVEIWEANFQIVVV